MSGGGARVKRDKERPAAPEPPVPAPQKGHPAWFWAESAAVAALFVLALALRVSYFSERVTQPDFSHPVHDALFYDSMGRTMAENLTGRPMRALHPVDLSTPYAVSPGYSWFLCAVYAVSGGSYRFAFIVQIALGLAACLLVWRLMRGVAGRAAGLAALLFFSTYWIFVYFEQEMQGWSLLVFCAALLFWALHAWVRSGRRRFAALAGAAAGCLFLLRGEMALFLPVVPLWWVFVFLRRSQDRRRGLQGLALFVLLALWPFMVLGLRNRLVAGEGITGALNGYVNLYGGNNSHVDGTFSDFDLPEVFGVSGTISAFEPARYLNGMRVLMGDPEFSFNDANRYFRRLLLGEIRENPGHIVWLIARKALLFWAPHEIGNNKEVYYDRAHSAVLRRLPGFPFAAALFLCAAGVWAARARRTLRAGAPLSDGDAFAPLFAALALVSFAVCVTIFVSARFRVPAVAGMLLAGAWLCGDAARMAASGDWRALARTAGAFALLFALLHLPLARHTHRLDIWHMDRALAFDGAGDPARALEEHLAAVSVRGDSAALYEAAHVLARMGRHREAVALFRSALEHFEHVDGVWNGLAYSLLQLGERDEARTLFMETARRFPLFTLPMNNLGNMCADEGGHGAAAEWYARALAVDPADPNANYNMGRLNALLGQWGEARGWFVKAVEADPGHVEAQNYLGYTLFRLGRPAEAVSPLEAAVRLNPEGTLQRVNLADALAALNRNAEAAAQYRAAADLFDAAGDAELARLQRERARTLSSQ